MWRLTEMIILLFAYIFVTYITYICSTCTGHLITTITFIKSRLKAKKGQNYDLLGIVGKCMIVVKWRYEGDLRRT